MRRNKCLASAADINTVSAIACVLALLLCTHGRVTLCFTHEHLRPQNLRSPLQAQNIRPGFRFGLAAGLVNAALETWLYPLALGGSPWQWQNTQADHSTLRPAAQSKQLEYPECALAIASCLHHASEVVVWSRQAANASAAHAYTKLALKLCYLCIAGNCPLQCSQVQA